MNCPKCGQPVDPGATFCGNCGQPLQSNTAIPPAPVVQPVQQPFVGGPAVTTPGPGQPGVVSPAPPAVTPIAQVMANQTPSAAPSINTFTPAPGAVSPGGGMPAYAMPAAAIRETGETRAIVGLILGVIGIPAALIPIAGLVLGIIGLVLSTTARAHYKHLISLLGIIFSSLAIIAALGVFVLNVEHNPNVAHSSSGGSASTGSMRSISTPCYDVNLVSGLNNYSPSGCDFDSASTTNEFTVNAIVKPDVTAATLQQFGQQVIQAGVKNINGTITSHTSGTFAGSPAYIAQVTSPSDGHGTAAIVLHPSADQQNLFYVAHFVKGNSESSLSDMEKNWQWH